MNYTTYYYLSLPSKDDFYNIDTFNNNTTNIDTLLKNNANAIIGALNDIVALESTVETKADLVNGVIPAAQLPSYVDDVIEVANYASLPATGTASKIYVTLDDNKTYRWGGSSYVEVSPSVALGETSSSAYRGDRGKTAYDHSQATGNPHGTRAANINITDTGAYFATDTVEAALQQIGSDLNGLATALEGLL